MVQWLLIYFDLSDIFISLNVKIMLLKIYYEEGEYDVFEFLLESMWVYFKCKNVIGYYKDGVENILKYM